MRFPFLPLAATLTALLSLVACDASTYHERGGKWAYGDTIFSPKDAPSFEPLDGDFARDAQRGYDGYRDQENLDETGKPRRVVRMLRGADPLAARVLGRGYAADARHVWRQRQLVVDADAATFAVDASYEGSIDANDKSGTWNAGQHVVAPT